MSVLSMPQRTRGKTGIWMAATGAFVALAVGVGVVSWQGSSQEAAVTSAVAPVAPTTASVSSQAMQPPTLYLVGTAAAADTLQAHLGEAEAILATLGTAPPTTEVLVVATAEEEQRLQRAIYEHDLIRGGLGLPPAQVIDLRGQS